MSEAERESRRTAGGRYFAPHRLASPLIATIAAMLLTTVPSLTAQSLADRVRSVADGQVRFSFAAREGICGDGERISTRHETVDWEGWCEAGPVRVALDISDGIVIHVDTYVGGRWRERAGTEDLGMVSVTEATDYLLRLAETASGDVSEHAVFPATLADSIVIWPRLLGLAKDERRPRDTRKAAVLWLSMAAADVAVAELAELATEPDTDIEVRKMALFGLSQLEGNRGVPVLLDIARTHQNRELRKQAIFWLGQTDDPRALALFEEILTRKE